MADGREGTATVNRKDWGASRVRATKRQKMAPLEGAGPHMRRCVERWNLQPPFDLESPDALWAAYYAERATLEFREANFFGEGGKEPASFPRCYNFQKCGETPSVLGSAGGPAKKCGVCSKARGLYTRMPASVTQAWIHAVASDEGLQATCRTRRVVVWTAMLSGYRTGEVLESLPRLPEELWRYVFGFVPGNPSLPPMQPHCHESYADSCHESGTTKGQFEDFAERLRERVAATLSSTRTFSGAGESAARAAAGALVLSYWVNYEDTGVGATARTIEFQTRFYAPAGTGASVDLSWYHHYRMRNTIAPEKYSTLYVKSRSLGGSCPDDPTGAFEWRGADENGAMCLACLDGDTDERQVGKTFATLVQLRALRDALFGTHAKVSPRKTFGLLARASGAHIVNTEAGWLYVGMRERYELYEDEDSAGEEDGPPDGVDGCAIM